MTSPIRYTVRCGFGRTGTPKRRCGIRLLGPPRARLDRRDACSRLEPTPKVRTSTGRTLGLRRSFRSCIHRSGSGDRRSHRVVARRGLVAGAAHRVDARRRGGTVPSAPTSWWRASAAIGIVGSIATLLTTTAVGPVAIPIGYPNGDRNLRRFALGPARSFRSSDVHVDLLVPAWVAGLLAFSLPIVGAVHGTSYSSPRPITTALDSGRSWWPYARRHSLAPRLSPKKTVEGLRGGVIAAVLVALLFARVQPFQLESAWRLRRGDHVRPLGDLAFSRVNAASYQDLGALARGHGGVMDMIDARYFIPAACCSLHRWSPLSGARTSHRPRLLLIPTKLPRFIRSSLR